MRFYDSCLVMPLVCVLAHTPVLPKLSGSTRLTGATALPLKSTQNNLEATGTRMSLHIPQGVGSPMSKAHI